MEAIINSWVSSPVMADHLCIHKQTLLRLRRHSFSPFKEGRDFRWSGLTTSSNLQWHVATTEKSFTSFRRMPADQVETFSRKAATK
jgi:hypothetical protein